jgi:ATPase family associated with various cellular activities (AAA)
MLIQKMKNQSSEAKLLEELDTLIRARYTLLAVNTYEEERLKEILLELVTLEKHREKPLYFWSRTNGIIKIIDEKASGIPLKEVQTIPETEDPLSALEHIAGQQTGIFLLCDFAPYIAPYGQEDPILVRLLREVAWKLKTTKATILFAGPNFPDIKTLEKEVSAIELDLPQEEEILGALDIQLEKFEKSGIKTNVGEKTRGNLVQALLGLTNDEISNVIAKATISCNGLTENALSIILDEKKKVIRGSSALTYVHPEPANSLGGYQSLREILKKAAHTFSPEARERHVEPCKGILLVGLPGCGKDLCKRVASSITNRALLDLDFGSIMGEGGGVIGQAAISVKRALSIATTVKGILGISEFEKAVSGMKSSGKTDGGETARTISYLLNWMQDNRDVLVFATANDVRDLESEQFRIGRFSYIHFVDLPNVDDREAIFRVHLAKRALVPEDFDLDVLAEKSEQFSGAEIEGAVGDAVLEAFIDGDRPAVTKDVIKAIGSITPTAEMMKSKIDEIREWAKKNIKGNRPEVQQAAATPGARVLEI